jgi:hypothetical protein
MYLVELRPGKEELYRSSDELALAIRNGDVDGRSRIYHRATAKWISITLHPQYKAINTSPKEESATRPARKGWTFLGGIAPTPQPAPQPAISGGHLLHRWRGPVALGITGALLMVGMKLAFSGPRPPWSSRSPEIAANAPRRIPAIAQEPVVPETTAQEMVSLASTTAWAPEPTPSIDTVVPVAVTKAVRRLPRAPRLRSKSLRAALDTGTPKEIESNTVAALLGRYAGANDAVRQRLETGIRVARLGQLFATSRLNPDRGVTDTRMSLAGAASVIRVYRQQQAAIEAAYQDSVLNLAKQFGWTPKQLRLWRDREVRAETPALEALSRALLGGIDGILGVLDDQAGAYMIRGNAIVFEDPSAAQRYGALRRRIKEQIDAAVAVGGATSPGPTGLLLQAIGTTSLPRET